MSASPLFSPAPHRAISAFYWIAAFTTFAYCLTRVWTVSITFDEAWTVQSFAAGSIADILRNIPPDANNHLLNTLLIKLSMSIAGDSLTAARAPNLLFNVVFLYYAVRICRRRTGGLPGMLAFILLTGNPFLLDFFSLARGYGMAIACELAALYHAASFMERVRERDAYAVFIWSLLSVTANFSLLLFSISVCFWILVYAVRLMSRRLFIRFATVLALLLLAGLLLLVPPLHNLLAAGGLYYGGESGFYLDTVQSLIKYSLYRPHVNTGVQIVAAVSVSVLVLFTIISLRWNRAFCSFKMFVLLLLGTAVAGTVLQHLLIGTLYPINRAALSFYPMACLLLAMAVKDLPARSWQLTASMMLALPVCINLAMKANLHKTALWYFESRTPQILQDLEVYAASRQRTLVVDYAWPMSNSISHALKRGHFPHLTTAMPAGGRGDANPEANIYILLHNDLEKVGYGGNIQLRLLSSSPHRVLWTYPEEYVEILEIQH